jgi:hypothetical protein
MKYIFSVTIGLLASPVVVANCDNIKLDAEHLIECITIEGSGENYHHWKSEHAKIGTGQSREETENKMKSSAQQPVQDQASQ